MLRNILSTENVEKYFIKGECCKTIVSKENAEKLLYQGRMLKNRKNEKTIFCMQHSQSQYFRVILTYF